MKIYVIVPILIGAMSVWSSAKAQQPTTPVSELTGALIGMGGASIQTVTLSGNAETIAGSSNDSGTFTGNCAINGSSQLSVQLSSSSRTENRLVTNNFPSGNWTDSSGVQHAMVLHNLYTPASWFCPVVELYQIASSSSVNVEFIGNEPKNGMTLAHFTVTSIPSVNSPLPALTTHLAQVDLYLNPQTMLPMVLDFNIHPDNNALTDIPTEITFSNYSQVSGVWIPFSIERYVNSTLTLSLQVQSATPVVTSTSN